jgi:ABC-type transport system involved in multi-copper enzyme maturation permease subunit
MSELAKWNNFYVIVGSAAGALIGLQFVVLTLLANNPPENAAAGGAAFGSPTVVHFCVTLFLSALLHAPWESITFAAAIWGVFGFGGVLYMLIVARRMKKHVIYKPIFEDWLFHCIVPLVAYAILALSSLVAASSTREALFCVGGASLLLLFDGIHNAWDNIAYHALVTMPKRKQEHPRNAAKTIEGNSG